MDENEKLIAIATIRRLMETVRGRAEAAGLKALARALASAEKKHLPDPDAPKAARARGRKGG